MNSDSTTAVATTTGRFGATAALSCITEDEQHRRQCSVAQHPDRPHDCQWRRDLQDHDKTRRPQARYSAGTRAVPARVAFQLLASARGDQDTTV
jgi:hypothetical protein